MDHTDSDQSVLDLAEFAHNWLPPDLHEPPPALSAPALPLRQWPKWRPGHTSSTS